MEEFYPKTAQITLIKLKTAVYYQYWRLMDEYIDKFKNLIDQARYSEELAIVTSSTTDMHHTTLCMQMYKY